MIGVDNMKTVKENLLFRLEKFGGILINKTTFARIELNKLEACFLYAVRYCGLEKTIKYFEDNYQTQGLHRQPQSKRLPQSSPRHRNARLSFRTERAGER